MNGEKIKMARATNLKETPLMIVFSATEIRARSEEGENAEIEAKRDGWIE